MKFKFGAYLTILAGAMTLLSACEGGSDTTVPIGVSVLQNPVLVNYSTTVVANFSNYSSFVRPGTPITFTVAPATPSFSHVSPNTATFSHDSTVTTTVVNAAAGGLAWVTVKSPLPGKFVVTATSGDFNGTTKFGGSTSVSFIDQPATVEVSVGLRKPLTNVGWLTFDLVSTLPAPVFDNFSGIQSPNIFNEDTNPIVPPGGIPNNGATNLIIGSMNGFNIVALQPQFKYHFVPFPPSVPTFTLANIDSHAADLNATPLSPTLFIMGVKYFDAAGNEMFY